MSKSLNGRMEFDHVVEVHADGSVTDTDLHAPGLYDDEVQSDDWELMNGYSGQYGYSGPMMHDSEYIGGGLERDILAQPGYYVALVNYVTTEDPEDDDNMSGWAVAFRESEES
jgi:hypothetical protein